MAERIPIPVGQNMSERYCRLLGYIGALNTMSAIGDFQLSHDLPATTNKHAHHFRVVCRMLSEEKYTDARTKFEEAHLNHDFAAMADKLRFVRRPQSTSKTTAPVMDGHLRMAFDYIQGESPYFIPERNAPVVESLFDFYATRAVQDYAGIVAVTHDQTESETLVVNRALGDIQYEVMYL